MTTTRQDAWTQDEDLMLAEIVLRQIREGGTQLAAFEDVGRKLSRTAAACGFRWNSYVRKQYKSAIEIAKTQRKQLRSQEPNDQPQKQASSTADHESAEAGALTFQDVISFLRNYENLENAAGLKSENEKLAQRIKQLEFDLEQAKSEKETIHNNLKMVEEDYMMLIEMMEKARNIAVMRDDERSRKVNFQVDQNGKIERTEK
ncbi:RsfA family transcriptional regulator [Metabacillus indicus]|uniref:RsfA family transcriptional regulator n=1 Tax=Metabacillus indicus TaxID=246786 RepID=UPI003CFA74BA